MRWINTSVFFGICVGKLLDGMLLPITTANVQRKEKIKYFLRLTYELLVGLCIK